MVDKILAFEGAGLSVDGPAVIVSDNPDSAGDFEAEAIATTLLASRDPQHVSLAQLGTEATRAAILDAFDAGPSLLSYLGHGGQQLWAHETIFNVGAIGSLAPRSQQPLVLTMNCLNGYFHYPYYDSLAEELVKADGKGAIAVFSPSGSASTMRRRCSTGRSSPSSPRRTTTGWATSSLPPRPPTPTAEPCPSSSVSTTSSAIRP